MLTSWGRYSNFVMYHDDEFFVGYQNVIKNIAKYNYNITLMNSLNRKAGVMMDERGREREGGVKEREREERK